MTRYVYRTLRGKKLRIRLDVFEVSRDGDDINLSFDIESVTIDGQEFELTTAERGELWKSIWDDDTEYEKMLSDYSDYLYTQSVTAGREW